MKAIEAKTKICKQCKLELSTTLFYEQSQTNKIGVTWRYFDTLCKTCRCDYASNRRREIKKQAVEYLGGECVDCHLRTHRVEVYDFHHRDPTGKDFSIGKQAKSFSKIKSELDKCELLCATCHRLRHGNDNYF